MKLFEKSAINVALKNIARSVTITRQRVQSMAEQAVAYSIIHGDISVGKSLIEAASVNKSLRRDSLVAYLEKYGNFAWIKADKTFKFYESYKVGTLTAEHEALFLNVKWDEAKREQEITSVFDVEDAVRRFIAKLHKSTSDAAVKVEHGEALQVVEQAFNKWSALNALREMKVDQGVIEQAEVVEHVHAAKQAADAEAWEAAELGKLAIAA